MKLRYAKVKSFPNPYVAHWAALIFVSIALSRDQTTNTGASASCGGASVPQCWINYFESIFQLQKIQITFYIF